MSNPFTRPKKSPTPNLPGKNTATREYHEGKFHSSESDSADVISENEFPDSPLASAAPSSKEHQEFDELQEVKGKGKGKEAQQKGTPLSTTHPDFIDEVGSATYEEGSSTAKEVEGIDEDDAQRTPSTEVLLSDLDTIRQLGEVDRRAREEGVGEEERMRRICEVRDSREGKPGA